MEKYSILKEIGKGSFGVAILCERRIDGKKCVIKQISLVKMPTKEISRTLQESALLGKLRHPNIISLYESFIDKGKQRLAIVMEYANGGDLEQMLKARRGRPFPENDILQMFVQMSLAIKHIHDRKILHRDLKCQNVFLTTTGIIKIGDFGIAKVLKDTRELAATRIGTPYYMSPELMDNKKYNSKTDIWSLGIILYELLCMRLPFEGKTMNELVRNIIQSVPLPPPSTYSCEIRDLVLAMLAKSTTSRPGINAILSKEIIKKRISSFLNDNQYDSEFSHTVLHGQQVLSAAAAAVAPAATRQVGPAAVLSKPAPSRRVNPVAFNPSNQAAILREQQLLANQAALAVVKKRREMEDMIKAEKKRFDEIAKEKKRVEDVHKICEEKKAIDIAAQKLFFKAFNNNNNNNKAVGPNVPVSVRKVDIYKAEAERIFNKMIACKAVQVKPTGFRIPSMEQLRKVKNEKNHPVKKEKNHPVRNVANEQKPSVKQGIDVVLENLRMEREKKIRERNALAAAAAERVCPSNKPAIPSPHRGANALLVVPYSKVEARIQPLPSLEEVAEKCQEMIETTSPKNRAIGSRVKGLVGFSSSTDSESAGGSVNNFWLGDLNEKMAALQLQVGQMKGPPVTKQCKTKSNVHALKDLESPEESRRTPTHAAAVGSKKATPSSRDDAFYKAKVGVVGKDDGSDVLLKRKLAREQQRAEFHALIKAQKGRSPREVGGDDVSPSAAVKPKDKQFIKNPKAVLACPVKVNNMIANGGGAVAVREQRDAERRQLRDYIASSRAAKATSPMPMDAVIVVASNVKFSANKGSSPAASKETAVVPVCDPLTDLIGTCQTLSLEEATSCEEPSSQDVNTDDILVEKLDESDPDYPDEWRTSSQEANKALYFSPEASVTDVLAECDNERDEFQTLIECMKVAAEVALRSDASDEEFEESTDSDVAGDDREEEEGQVRDAWGEANEMLDEDHVKDNELQEYERVERFGNEEAEGGVDDEDEEGEEEVKEEDQELIDEGAIETEDVNNSFDDDIDPELSKRDDDFDPLHHTTLLSSHKKDLIATNKLRVYLEEELGKEKVRNVLTLLQTINDTDKSEEEILVAVESIVGAENLNYLDDFFKLLTS